MPAPMDSVYPDVERARRNHLGVNGAGADSNRACGEEMCCLCI